MNLYRYIFSMLCVLAILVVTGCDGDPVFTEMSTNRLKIKIKGTLESDTTTQNIAFDHSVVADDSVDDLAVQVEDAAPTKFMFDIAEIRLDGKEIGKYRQVFDIDLDDSEPFFNGSGVNLKNDDPPDGTYHAVQLYIRKMIFDNARVYESSGTGFTFEDWAEVIFHEDEVNGFNFGSLQVNSYWDSLRDNASDKIRIYPLRIPIIGGLKYDRSNDETVLEVRIVIKNFIKMYEYDYYEDGVFKVCHFYGLSDWLRDVRADEHDMGKNIRAVARAYVPGDTGTISGTGAAANCYVIAIPYGEPDTDFYTTDTGEGIRDAVGACDLPVTPVYANDHIESILDYYCNYEAYKESYNTKIATCSSLSTYETAWDTYEAAVSNFKLAPYITLADGGGNYEFSNVAPGRYKVYYYNQAASAMYGSLFDTPGNFVSLVADITVH